MTSIGITGHQVAPAWVWEAVADQLPQVLGSPPFTGVSSLAAGADQEFADMVLTLGGNLCAVIPCHDYVSSFETAEQRVHFESLLARARSIEQLDYPEPSEDAYHAAGHRVVDLSDKVVAVWDGRPANGKGGTADIVGYARSLGKRVIVIWPTGAVR